MTKARPVRTGRAFAVFRGLPVDERVVEVLASWSPSYRVDRVALLGAGQDNVAWEVNGELVVRFAKAPDPVETDREARLLAKVAEVSPLPVPTPVFSVPESGCLVYRKLPGSPLLGLSGPPAVPLGAVFGGYLAALHAVPVERMADVVGVDDDPLPQWLSEAAELYAPDTIPPVHRGPVESFLSAAPPLTRSAKVFSHNDLGVEHVLVDARSWTVTGVIDWTDAALCDPAYDFGLLYRDLGPAALDAALAAYGNDSLRERAVFYGRCTVLEDLAYALDTGKAVYADKSLTALNWLFSGR
ncbi:aminoglycoside phosphotransferase family protein [Umezawaea sp. Da 62-37]|uniref:phosphotransferase family protein n=1 Tax=Umezawaea sp. Da 62-37 TaxID=3075927 RepID=UPI0028F6D0B5|nr:aminoglycoside phosphotransferase family protein [Umezawaea sp. Da 62-37]WNV88753.1 aminoglycoside phosphotransferase family protein [Umezawaea sp. Da 62-37]